MLTLEQYFLYDYDFFSVSDEPIWIVDIYKRDVQCTIGSWAVVDYVDDDRQIYSMHLFRDSRLLIVGGGR